MRPWRLKRPRLASEIRHDSLMPVFEKRSSPCVSVELMRDSTHVVTGSCTSKKEFPSLFNICIDRISQCQFFGTIDRLPVELCEVIIKKGIPLCRTLSNLSSLLHSCMLDLDLTNIHRSIDLKSALQIISSNCCHIQTLNLPSHTSDSNLFTSETGPFPFLTHLTVSNSSTITGAGLLAVTSNLRNGLESLSIQRCISVSNDGVIALLNANKRTLVDLDISGCSMISDAVSYHLPDAIVRLSVAKCWRITDEFLRIVSKQCIQLQELDLSADPVCSGAVTIFGAMNLKNLKCLSSLDLRFQKGISGVAIVKLKQSCPLLKDVEFDDG